MVVGLGTGCKAGKVVAGFMQNVAKLKLTEQPFSCNNTFGSIGDARIGKFQHHATYENFGADFFAMTRFQSWLYIRESGS